MTDTVTTPVNIICIKWGTRYGPEFVNRLYAGVRRNLTLPFWFYCCTDDQSELDRDILIIPFPENPGIQRAWPDILVKVMIFKDGFGGLQGPTLFFDLDVAITGLLDPFFEYCPGEFCIIRNWVMLHKRVIGRKSQGGNTSVFRFEAGKSGQIYELLMSELDRAEDRSLYNGDQEYTTYAVTKLWKKAPIWWPEAWCRSFKRHCTPIFPLNLILPPSLPTDCRILVFHGHPDPDEAVQGFRGKKLRHRTRPAYWIQRYWRD